MKAGTKSSPPRAVAQGSENTPAPITAFAMLATASSSLRPPASVGWPRPGARQAHGLAPGVRAHTRAPRPQRPARARPPQPRRRGGRAAGMAGRGGRRRCCRRAAGSRTRAAARQTSEAPCSSLVKLVPDSRDVSGEGSRSESAQVRVECTLVALRGCVTVGVRIARTRTGETRRRNIHPRKKSSRGLHAATAATQAFPSCRRRITNPPLAPIHVSKAYPSTSVVKFSLKFLQNSGYFGENVPRPVSTTTRVADRLVAVSTSWHRGDCRRPALWASTTGRAGRGPPCSAGAPPSPALSSAAL